jgi:hypothetical protein
MLLDAGAGGAIQKSAVGLDGAAGERKKENRSSGKGFLTLVPRASTVEEWLDGLNGSIHRNS